MHTTKLSVLFSSLFFLPTLAFSSIDIASGTETQIETDYLFKSSQPLSFSRYYNHAYKSWRFDFSNSIKYSNINNLEILTLIRPNFESIIFRKINNVWTETSSSLAKLEFDSSNNITLTLLNGDKEFYKNSNNSLNSETIFSLSKIIKSNGQYFDIEQISNTQTIITDINNNVFNINYKTCNNIKIVDNFVGIGNKTTTYSYDSSCSLSSVTYPDQSTIKYTYSSGYLYKIFDETNNLYKTIGYVSSSNTYQPGHKASYEAMGTSVNINKITSTYSTVNKVKVTDALNNSLNINTIKNNNSFKIVGYESICSFCKGIQGNEISYNPLGLIDTVKDFKGNVTKYTWNNDKKITQVIEALGTNLERTSNFTYNSNGFLSTKSEPVSGGYKTTSYTYNANNLITNINEIAPSNSNNSSYPNISKEYSFIYEQDKIIEARGPLYNAQDKNKVSFTYNTRGQIYSVTNGLNQTTYFNNYDDYGNVSQITLPNSNVIFMNYDLRGRIITSTLKSSLLSTDSESTFYTYSVNGLVTKITKPSGSSYVLSYDNASRLISIEEWSEPTTSDVNGVYQGKLSYTLDNMSNVKKIEVFDKNNVGIRLNSKEYDSKNRLYKNIGALNQTNTYLYDANSNLTSNSDADNYLTTMGYDNLNRIFSITSPDQSVIQFNYNPDDTTASIVDPKGLTTSYIYDGFGNLIQQNSPDSGLTSFAYNLTDNLISKTDAKGNTSNYTYDYIGRLTRIDYVNSTEFSQFTYDTCMIGKLCKEENQNSKTTYTYNLKGKIASTRTESANNLTDPIFDATIEYGYNDYGQLTLLTYPNQNKVIYTYFNDKVSNVSYYIHTTNETKELVSNIEYPPFSNIEERMTWRTSQGDFNHSKIINKDGVITSIVNTQANGLNLSLSYDNRLNINKINNSNDNIEMSNTYDNRSRIISSSFNSLSPTNYGYSYNTSSDRTSSVKNTNLSTYTYDNNSHKLLNVSGYDNHQYSYDLNGNTITQNTNTFTYNTSNRLAKVINNSEDTDYFYNSFGERYLKHKKSLTNNNEDKNWFIYDGSSLLYEKNESNIASEEINYIYLNGKPIGIIKNNDIYYIQTDHLGTPRVILDSNNNLVWKWNYSESFGNNQPIETGLEFNLRFPGQYWDNEKSSSYNISRDYNPITGRYLQSDPIGLEAGINTYGYVDANPLSFIDEDGLLMMNLTTIESLKRNTTLEQAINSGTLTRMITMPLISIGLSPSTIGLVGSSFLGTTGIVADICFNPNDLVYVSRWGASRPNGLQNGDWVMKGKVNYWNYIKSGKWEKHRWNEYAPYSTGEQHLVKRMDLSTPSSIKNPVIDGKWKSLYGQRLYNKAEKP